MGRRDVEEVQRTFGAIAAWTGGIAMFLGVLLWLDSQGKR